MKKQMVKLPTLTAPAEGETLIMYIFVAKEAVSAVLLAERGDRQIPIYFVGKALQSPEINYTLMKKLVLALVHATRRLRRYFQAHPVAVVTNGVKAKEAWRLFTDGSSIKGGSGVGIILNNPAEVIFTYALRFEFKASNNEAEYDAMLAGLRINDLYQAKEEAMQKYLNKARDLIARFKTFTITQVLRSQTKQADALSKMAFVSFAHLTKRVLVEVLPCKSIKGKEVMAIVEESGRTWMKPITKYLERETLPTEKGKAWQLKARAKQYVLLEGNLYRKSFIGPWLRCVGPE
ncbi:reverse transcriptase domain-containing protein [Tanacetum coccineum]